jgi:hypothetical protein
MPEILATQEDLDLKPPWANSSRVHETLTKRVEKPFTKKGLVEWLKV